MSRFRSALAPAVASRPSAALVLLALALAVLLAPGAARAEEPGNLLRNGSFEEGTLFSPAGWDTTPTPLPTVRFNWEEGGARDGSRSVYVVSASDLIPLWNNWNQTLVGVNELGGKELVLRGWVRTRAVSGKAYILLQAYRDTVLVASIREGVDRLEKRQQMRIKPADDPQLEMGWARKQVSGDHPEWTPLEARLYIPPSTNVVIVRGGLLGVGEAWFDDFTLTAGPARPEPPVPVGKNLLADPGFEGNLDEWDFSMPPVEGLRIDADTASHSGKQSVLIDCPRRFPMQIWTHAFQVFNTRALSGKRVRLSGWYKCEGLNNTFACLSVAATGMYGNFRPTVGNAWSGTEGWTHTSYEIDIPPDTYTVWARVVLNTGVGKVWFDDMKFEVIGDAAPAAAAKTPSRGGKGRKR